MIREFFTLSVLDIIRKIKNFIWIKKNKVQLTGFNLKLGNNVRVIKGIHPDTGCKGCLYLGDNIEFQNNVEINCYGGNIQIGDNTYIGNNSILYGHGGIEIGKKCLIAMNVVILSSNHTIPKEGNFIRDFPDIRKKTIIGDDVWISAGCIILAGVTIGSGSIIGAGAVITQNIGPNCIVKGDRELIIKNRK